MTDPLQPRLLHDEPAPYAPSPQEQALREEYRARLRLFLEDPAAREIEGFPIAENADILALSDPPYYTACPNPFLGEIIAQWQSERSPLHPQAGDGEGLGYHREPFAADVSEGKNDPIYNAHSYHTKVPHKAIMRYILHYTEPGDIVFDGFCGSGMTGVAAQLCGDKKAVESLGYFVDENGYVYEKPPSPTGRGAGGEGAKPISRLGARKAVLVDLSPAATFIAYNYNTPVDVPAFEGEARRILDEVGEECGWMYETLHTDGKTKGKINYTIWSDVFVCPQCSHEIIFWDVAMDKGKGEVRDDWPCPACGARLAKSRHKGSGALKAERAWEMIFDRSLQKTVRRVKQSPVLINYSVGTKRYEKLTDPDDLELIRSIEESEFPYPFPSVKLPEGDKTSDPLNLGITNIHHFYTRRNLWLQAALGYRIDKIQDQRYRKVIKFLWQSLAQGYTRLNRYGATHYSQVNRILNGTLYVSSIISEVSLEYAFRGKLKRIVKAFRSIALQDRQVVLTTQSSSQIMMPDSCADYFFVDPPFGSNLMYSELNFLWESWLEVLTNNLSEAVANKSQRKGLPEYQALMEECFSEFIRVLKPGHWMTIEFHNSQNTVWNVIQEALFSVGFMVADIRTFDKQQGTFNQVTATGSVKQDLIISAYKPNNNLEERFKLQAGSEEGAWAFVRYHLSQLPQVVEEKGKLEVVAERQAYLLFDRMVAFHIQRGASVPLSASEFYTGLKQRFIERDGMYFLPDQVPAYDAARLRGGQPAQLALFVSDEKSAIQWLRQRLDPALGGGPQTRQDIIPDFQRQLHQSRHESLPELDVILEQNFLTDEAGRWRVPDPTHAGDLEKLRQRALLREFKEYTEGRGRLRQFRSEAVRAGFAEAYKQRDFATILKVAERLPEAVLHEDPDLLMYYDTAMLRVRQ